MKRSRAVRRQRVECPDCEYISTVTVCHGIRRFRARSHICPECEQVSRLAEFNRPWSESGGER